MRLILSALAALLALAWVAPDDAAAQSRGARAKKGRTQAVVARRPASVGPNGLCQRDTGTPTSQLNFRNQCDTEEFWRRIMDRAGSSGR